MTDISLAGRMMFVETHADDPGNLLSHNCNKLFLVPTTMRDELFGIKRALVGDSLDLGETVYCVGSAAGFIIS